MISTATAFTMALRQPRLRTNHEPRDERDHGRRQHRRDEPGRNLVGQPLNRSAAALRVAHHLHDLRQQSFAAHALGAHQQPAGAVHRGADNFVAGALFHRHGFARHHGLVHRAEAVEHHAVHRNLLAGTHAQLVADLHLLERDVVFAAVVAHDARQLRRQIEQAREWRYWCGCAPGVPRPAPAARGQ